MELNLDQIRKEIDAADHQLVEIFCKRMDLVKQVAGYKIANDMQVLHPDREKIILDKVEEEAGSVYGAYTRELYVEIMRLSRQMQQKLIDGVK